MTDFAHHPGDPRVLLLPFAVDESLGQVTDALVAVPFYLGGHLRGVVSCVRWRREDPDIDTTFTAAHLDRVRQLANTLERLLNYQLLKVVLDFDA